ncbi:MAG: hypothetical protein N2578_01525, partial [Bdellovibrionaceae bacterium]|nr:hypothetical protein [Pseudobdellovibrionaceae bacterium]
MTKHLVSLFLALWGAFFLQSCSSRGGAEDDAVVADELPVAEDGADGDILGSGELTAEPADAVAGSPPAEQGQAAASDVSMAPVVEEPPPPVVSSEPPPVSQAEKVMPPVAPEPSKPASEPARMPAPLQKVASVPWKIGGQWMNTVYIARPSDTLSSISTMIYGADKSDQLRKWNPRYEKREVKPGDKVYYNSPNRPDDSERVLTFYEDNGLQPEIYVAQPGDNIRQVSTNLLGYDMAWKEIWSTNPVESKGELPEGTQLRFWRTAAATPAVNAPEPVAESPPPPVSPAPTVQEPAPELAVNEPPPPPPMPPAEPEIPPPPPVQA